MDVCIGNGVGDVSININRWLEYYMGSNGQDAAEGCPTVDKTVYRQNELTKINTIKSLTNILQEFILHNVHHNPILSKLY